MRRRPGEARLDQHHLQRREALEHALEDQAGQHRLLALRVPHHLLDVVGGPAAAGQGGPAIAEGVDAYRQVGLRRRLVDRPVAPLAEWFGGARQQQHLGEVAVAGARLDHACGSRAIFERHHHRCLQPRVARGPFRHLPLIGGVGQRSRQVEVLRALAAGQRIEHAERNVVRVKVLLGHECEVAAGIVAVRPGVAAAGLRLPLGVGGTAFPRLAVAHADRLDMLAPAPRQVRIQRLAHPADAAAGGRGWMSQSAIARLRLRRRLYARAVQHVDVHVTGLPQPGIGAQRVVHHDLPRQRRVKARRDGVVPSNCQCG